MIQKIKTKHFGIMMLFSFIVFLAVLVNSFIAVTALYLLVHNDVIQIDGVTLSEARMLVQFFVVINIPVGIAVALMVSNVPLKPIRDLIHSMDSLASGNFKTRVNVGNVMRRYPPFVEVSESFNKMAEQLENTEMLRSDFINNFSHEFKTPIVSIAGFARLLRRGDLTERQRQEYLRIIEAESKRLSYMATNVLNLTKIENQTILTDVAEYNLSEQLRSCILLLEDKWGKKELEFNLELDERPVRGSEELLKQVWINLLDNAIKFSPKGGQVDVLAQKLEGRIAVAVCNSGPEIPPHQMKKIFHKFYQGDESHASEGNGVGLAIVKRVVELHRGSITVDSGEGKTTFTVYLPAE